MAEARVLRAYDYFLLANLWGTPPFVDHVLTGSDQPYNCDKDPVHPMTHEQLIEWVANECEEASADLDERKSKDDKDGAVKVTKVRLISLRASMTRLKLPSRRLSILVSMT